MASGVPPKIVIDLAKQNLPESIAQSSSVIQHYSKQHLIGEIDKYFAKVGSNESTADTGHNVFFIDGTRGAGKTTFLKSIVNHYKVDREEHDQTLQKSVCTLDYIDPTVSETREHILFSIITSLHSRIKKALSKNIERIDNQNKLEDWKRELEKLARGMSLLNGSDLHKQSYDEVAELYEGLARSENGMSLACQVNRLLSKAASILGVKGFVIAFDDVDTQFKNGWEVLELVRRYLSSKHLVVLVSGDMRLYAHLVRGKQLDNFTDKQLVHEGDRKSEYQGMIDHLEQQYLLKLFPITQRITLSPIFQLINSSSKFIYIQLNYNGSLLRENLNDKDGLDKKIEFIEDATELLIVNALSISPHKKKDVRYYYEHFLQSPTRTVMQVLSQYYSSIENRENPRAALSKTLLSVYLSDLYKTGIDIDRLKKRNLSALIEAIFNHVIDDGDFNTGFYLRPMAISESNRNIAVTLASLVAEKCERSLSAILRVMFEAYASITIYHQLARQINNAENLDKFKEYLGVGRDEGVRNWAIHTPPCLLPDYLTAGRGIAEGIIKVSKRTPRNCSTLKGFDTFSNLSQKENSYARISLLASSSNVAHTNAHQFLSVFNLVSAVEGISSIKVTESKEVMREELLSSISRFCFDPTVVSAEWVSPSSSVTIEKDEGAIVNERQESVSFLREDYILGYIAWHQGILPKLQQAMLPSSILIGKIWTRFYFNLNRISDVSSTRVGKQATDEELDKGNASAATIMGMNIVAWLHSILFEESDYHQSKSQIFSDISDRENPVNSIVNFHKKLLKLKDLIDSGEHEMGELPVFWSMFTCPLFIPYLRAEKAFRSILIKDKTENVSFENTLKYLLNWAYQNTNFDPWENIKGAKHLHKAYIYGYQDQYKALLDKKKENP